MRQSHIHIPGLACLGQLPGLPGEPHNRLTALFVRNFDVMPGDFCPLAVAYGFEERFFGGESDGKMAIRIALALAICNFIDGKYLTGETGVGPELPFQARYI